MIYYVYLFIHQMIPEMQLKSLYNSIFDNKDLKEVISLLITPLHLIHLVRVFNIKFILVINLINDES